MNRRHALLLSCLLAVVTSRPCTADDWPAWRGPTRDGITDASFSRFARAEPTIAWQTNVGRGCSSPIVVGDHVYTHGWLGDARPRPGADGVDVVRCHDITTGKLEWEQKYPSKYHSRNATGDQGAYGGPSATPTFDADTALLFTLSLDGLLAAWDTAAAGKPRWQVDLRTRLTIEQRPMAGKGHRDFGFTSSPLIVDDMLLIEVPAKEAVLVAVDKRTGKALWRSEHRGPAGHTAGPVLWTVGRQRMIALLTLRELVVISIDGDERGRTIATYPWVTDFACNIPSPVVIGNRVLLTSGYNQSRMLLLELQDRKLTEVWTSRTSCTVSTPVIADDRIYAVDTELHCLNLADGSLRWKGGKFAMGTAVYGRPDRRLLVFGRGTLALVEASPDVDAFRTLWTTDRLTRGDCYPHIAFTGHHIVLRDRDGWLAILKPAEP